MSTVVYRDGVISGDSLMAMGNQIVEGAEKIGRTETFLFGYAGQLGFLRPIYTLISELDKAGVHPQDFWNHWNDLDFPSDAGNVLLASRQGDIWVLSLDGYSVYVPRKYESIGSGEEYALGALVHGATATQAVSCACVLDAHTGGTVNSWSFDMPVHCPNEK